MIPDTKLRILEAAEQLFSVAGFAATSVREIATRAEANLAAVNYHFGSKDELVREVFVRRFGPLNEARVEMLTAAEQLAQGRPVALDAIVRAMVSPALRLGADQGNACMTLMGRLHSEPPSFVAELFRDLFRDVRERFVHALTRSAPHLAPGETFLRMYFVVGAMAHTMVASHKLEVMSMGLCRGDDVDWIEDQLVAFGVAGLQTPSRPAPTRPATPTEGSR